ncbi:MAG: tetratricopeptide repeat protein [Bryobacterales bacterium]|nr:tetratricopeptide repeat protein [Bryobacterales bacterium]
MPENSALAIQNIDNSRTFQLTRAADAKPTTPVEIPSPYEFPVANRPNSNLMAELRWYLESFLDYPYHPETVHAENVLDSLKAWGTQAFNALFDRRDAGTWLAAATSLQIRSDDPRILSWPWEALYDPLNGYLAHHRHVQRCLNRIDDPLPLPNLPTDRVNILLVVARPYQNDVAYRSIARSLVEIIRAQGLRAHVDLLRPPTFDQLRAHLRAHPGYYHILHFDGHGGYGDSNGEYSAHKYQGRQGCLVFEDAKGEPDPQTASDLSTLLKEHAVPAVVLNACQSAMLDDRAEDAFASVATALLRSGMRSVVAMAYSLYVSGAKVFLPEFYRGVFASRNVAEAVRRGRQQMLSNKGRMSSRGTFPLEDWLLPVLYQQQPSELPFSADAAPALPEEPVSRLPPEVRDHIDRYGFIGRDDALLKLERALHRKTPAILIHGLGGVGKTSLARGFLRWLDETGGLDAALWLDFRDIRTAEYVIDRIGERLYDENFRLAKDKLKHIAHACRQQRLIVVWDNFETAKENLTPEDHSALQRLLDSMRGTRAKVVITSRSKAEEIGTERRFLLELGGLDGEERWDYCETILTELGLRIDRNDPALHELMKQLGGHPLAMRMLLPKLESMSAHEIGNALRSNLQDLGLEEGETRLFATLRFVEQGLTPELRPLLALVGLHEGYVDADYLEAMAKQVDAEWTRANIDRLLAELGNAGIVKDGGNAVFEMHPLLTSYLRSLPALVSEPCQRAFVDVMGRLADHLTPRPLHEQRRPFLLFGPSFHHALALSERLAIDQPFAALTQSLALFAQNSGRWTDASKLFAQLERHRSARGDANGQAGALHQLGMIAQERRDFATARDWYLKSLAIKVKQGNLHGAAISYHQLGIIAQEQRDFATARDWYLKSLAISEKQGIDHIAANTYGQLGIIAQEQRDFATARDWYLKSLEIKEKQGNLHGAASTYHQLGNIALEQRDFATARDWYLKSLAIKEKQGNLHGAAISYHQLGMVAEEQRDFATARDWYLKSLEIKEKQGNLHGAASTQGQLGILAAMEGDFEQAAQRLIRAITGFVQSNALHEAQISVDNFVLAYREAPDDLKPKLK